MGTSEAWAPTPPRPHVPGLDILPQSKEEFSTRRAGRAGMREQSWLGRSGCWGRVARRRARLEPCQGRPLPSPAAALRHAGCACSRACGRSPVCGEACRARAAGRSCLPVPSRASREGRVTGPWLGLIEHCAAAGRKANDPVTFHRPYLKKSTRLSW